MIYYICYYSCSEIDAQNRDCAPSARNKATYIINCLKRLGIGDVEIVSPSQSKFLKLVHGEKVKTADGIMVKTFLSMSSKNKLLNYIGVKIREGLFYIYIMKNIKQTDKVIVYHSISLMKYIKALKRIKKCEIILEVEEVYADVLNNKKLRRKEVDYFGIADRYLMITDLLNKQINIKNKPVAISHGNYNMVEPIINKKKDGKINVVYAGTFSVSKGALDAIGATEYLSEKYHVHILGFGKITEIENVKKEIARISKVSLAQITFHGELVGNEYLKFIQSCDIGLCTQDPNAIYNATSFPSKILSYMANGLRVVSIRIPAIETSNVGDYMYFYNKQTPENIAKAIMNVDISDEYDGRKIVSELDEQFCKDLNALLQY